MADLERGLGIIDQPRKPYYSRDNVPVSLDFAAVRRSFHDIERTEEFRNWIFKEGNTVEKRTTLMVDLMSYTRGVTEFVARRIHAATVEMPGFLQNKFVDLNDLINAERELREKNITEELLSAVQRSATAAVLETFFGDIVKELRKKADKG